MKRIASVVLTAALVLSMGVAAFAATPSKTVLDEVTASATVETSGLDITDVDTTETEETKAQSEDALKDLAASNAELKKLTEATAEENVEVVAVQTVTVVRTPLFNRSTATVELSSSIISAAYAENEEVTVLVMYPVTVNGKTTYQKMAVKGIVKDGKIRITLTGAQLKKIGRNKVTLVATKKVAKV